MKTTHWYHFRSRDIVQNCQKPISYPQKDVAVSNLPVASAYGFIGGAVVRRLNVPSHPSFSGRATSFGFLLSTESAQNGENN